MGSLSAETLALVLWCGMVLIKLAGLIRWWRQRPGSELSHGFSLEVQRRGLTLGGRPAVDQAAGLDPDGST
ncbi:MULTISPECIES: hypothetical protein [Aphanothece]|uniref:hypothetical protein n=1 Tax=Aphanothece TaxID=1121 RepID=UPI00398546DB